MKHSNLFSSLMLEEKKVVRDPTVRADAIKKVGRSQFTEEESVYRRVGSQDRSGMKTGWKSDS